MELSAPPSLVVERPIIDTDRLRLSVQLNDDVATVAVFGEVCYDSCDELRRIARAALACGNGRLVVDCTDMTFIDGGGLRVLAELVDHGRSHLYAVTLHRPSALARRLLAITKIDQMVTIT